MPVSGPAAGNRALVGAFFCASCWDRIDSLQSRLRHGTKTCTSAHAFSFQQDSVVDQRRPALLYLAEILVVPGATGTTRPEESRSSHEHTQQPRATRRAANHHFLYASI